MQVADQANDGVATGQLTPFVKPAPLAKRAATAVGNGPTREIFGFVNAGVLGDSSVGYPSWNFSLLTTVAYFALDVNSADGSIVESGTKWTVFNSGTMSSFVTTAHNNGTRVIVSINLHSDLCNGYQHIATTVSQSVSLVQSHGLDGVNLDYEGQNGPCGSSDIRTYQTSLVQQFRAGLGSGYYLAVDTYSGSAGYCCGMFDIAGMAPYVDSFFVMAYDMGQSNYSQPPLNCSSYCTNPEAPLSYYYYNDTTSMSQYVGQAGASKVILGVPYYGLTACTTSAAANAPITGSPQYVYPRYLDSITTNGYTGVTNWQLHRDPNDTAGQDPYSTWTSSTYNCTRESAWDDVTSLGAKYALVNQDNLRGVGIFTLDYGGGQPELWNTLYAYFVSCIGAHVGSTLPSPQARGVTVTMLASTSRCASPTFEFWLQAPGSTTWTSVQAYSGNGTYNWNTTGLAPGTYVFDVWIRNSGSPNSYDTYGLDSFTITAPCTSASLSAAPSSPQMAGTAITLTAVAKGCPAPSYRFWLQPSGGAWTQLRDYGTSATFQWNSAGLAGGGYKLLTWVKDASSSAVYDAYAGTDYVLDHPCTSVMDSASPASPQLTGAVVTISAQAAGCVSPRYRFWVLPPGGAWTMVQDYSSSSTYSWNTAGLASGAYRFSVWAEETGSSAGSTGYDVYNNGLGYNLLRPCSGAGLGAAPASPQMAGTAVTLTATAAGCSNPSYRFWVQSPSGAWSQLRDYSTTATFQWNTSGLPGGVYHLNVWVRDASSSTAYDAYSVVGYTVDHPCTSVGISTTPASPQAPGTTVTVSAAAAGCVSPRYRFWVMAPGGSYVIAQDYSAAATFSWNTTGLAKGVYHLAVWAEETGSGAQYDTYNNLAYTVG